MGLHLTASASGDAPSQYRPYLHWTIKQHLEINRPQTEKLLFASLPVAAISDILEPVFEPNLPLVRITANVSAKCRLRNIDGWQGVDFWISVNFQQILMEMGVLVHPQLGLRFGAALPGAFFSHENNTFD